MNNQNMGGYPQQPQQQPPQQPMYQMPQQQPPMYQMPPQPMPVQEPKKKKTGLIDGIIAGVLILLIVIGVVAAGGSPEKPFYGTWTITVDATDGILEEAGEMAAYFDEDFEYKFTATAVFNKDNTYSITLDQAAYQQTQDELVAQMKKALAAEVRDEYPEYASYTDDEIVALYEEGSGESFDDLFTDEDLQDVVDDFDGEGNFKVDENKLMLSDGRDYNVDEDKYYVFEVVSENEINCKEYYDNGVLDPDENFVLTR